MRLKARTVPDNYSSSGKGALAVIRVFNADNRHQISDTRHPAAFGQVAEWFVMRQFFSVRLTMILRRAKMPHEGASNVEIRCRQRCTCETVNRMSVV